jgi:PKHD-type hydroxylase
MAWAFNNEIVEPYASAENVFTKEQCEAIIQAGELAGVVDAAIGVGEQLSAIDEDYRKCRTSWLAPSDSNKFIYQNLTDAVNILNNKFFQFELFGFLEQLQFARYDAPNGKYDYHTDCPYHGAIRKLSISVQLSSELDYEGGELIVNYGSEMTLPKKQGSVIAFPSPTLHRVAPITKGTRYSLVGWVTGPRFK